MAWFGPKGVATMAFALFVLGSAVPEGERIQNIAALAVLTSVIAHGRDGPARLRVDRAARGTGAPALLTRCPACPCSR